MAISVNHSSAGRSIINARSYVVPAATVWDPSGVAHAPDNSYRVRTLRPIGRTQGLVLGPVPDGSEAAQRWQEMGQDRATKRREAFMTYVLGGLFGLCVVGVAVFQSEGENTADIPDYVGVTSSSDSAVVSAR